MDDLFRRNLKRSTIAHFVVVVILILAPLLFNWRVNRKTREIITFVDFTVALPEVPDIKPVKEVKAPEPPKPKADIPEPTKDKPKIEKSKEKVKRPPPKGPKLTQEEIRKLLAAGARISDTTSVPDNYWEVGYYQMVHDTMYRAWEQPGALSATAGWTAEVTIRVQRDGSITRRTLTRGSGSALMDESVMKAVNAVPQLKPLPSPFQGTYKDITITFELAREGA